MEEVHDHSVSQPVYAGFWRRFAAFIIDSALLKFIVSPVALLFLRNSGIWDLLNLSRKIPAGAKDLIGFMDPNYAILMQSLFRKAFYFGLFYAVFCLLYHAFWESSKFCGSPGKLAAGIKVSDGKGNRLSFIRALGRNFCKIFSGLIFMVGYLMAGFTQKKQALHDIICDCLVVKSETVHQPTQTFAYAGFWRRGIAIILDLFLLLVLLSPINIFLVPQNAVKDLLNSVSNPTASLPNINDLIGLVLASTLTTLIHYFYYASWESSRYQATPGKLAIGIKVVDLSGQRLSFWKASGRYVSKIVSNFTLLVGYMMAGWTTHEQALHDVISHCLVIKSDK